MTTQNDLFPVPLPEGINVEELKNLVPCSLWQSNPKLATYQALKRSYLFDEEDYLNRYPDVKAAKLDPIYHYIQHGYQEKRFFHVKYVNEIKKKDKNILLEKLRTPRLPYHELLSRLLQYDVIVLNIFDTAILRMVELPENIFEIIAVETNYPNFVALRMQAENLAKDRKYKKYGIREVTIDEIYNILDQYHISQDLKNRELELEYQLSEANPYIQKIYAELLEHRKTIVFCSDRALPKKIIENILHKNSYTQYEQILLLPELNLRKINSSLQQYLSDVYRGHTLIYVGTSEYCTQIQSENSGMDAIYNPNCRIADQYSEHNNLCDAITNAIYNNYLNTGLYQNNQYFTYGFVFGGVLVGGFCQFINDVALQNKTDVILFCGQECYIVQKIYDTFFKQIENFYVETSQFAVMCLNSEAYLYTLLHQVIFRYYDQYQDQKTIKDLLCETDFAFLADKLEENDLEEYLFCHHISKETLATFFLKNSASIQEHFAHSKQAATIYFSNMLQNKQNILIVDIDADCTYIKCVDSFLKKNINKNISIKGVLLFCNDAVEIKNKIITHQYYAYLQNSNGNNTLQIDKTDLIRKTFTSLLNTTETELISYAFDQENNIIFQRKTNATKNLKEIISIHKGIYEFNKLFCQYTQNLSFQINIPASTALSPFINILQEQNDLEEMDQNDLMSYWTDKTILFVTPSLTYTENVQPLLVMAQTAQQLGYLPVIITKQNGDHNTQFATLEYPIVYLHPYEIESSQYYPFLTQCYLCICNTPPTHDYVKVFSTILQTVCIGEINRRLMQYVEDQQQYALDYRPGSDQTIKVVQIGTIEYRTGYDLLIAAYKSLPEPYSSQIEIYFAGDFSDNGTPFASYIFTEIQDLNNVHFLGSLQDDTATIQLLSSMDVVVVASRDTSCSLPALQGAMLAKPLIVTEKAGVSYLITPDNGILVKNENVQDLHNALIDMVKKKDQLFQMGQESRRLYETKINLSVYTEQFKTFLEEFAPQPFAQNEFTQLTKSTESEDVLIVSLTSYPARMATLAQCLESIIKQEYQNKYIILWLSKMEFPNELADLPYEIQNMNNYALIKIKFVNENLKSHKKYFYAMQEYPEYPIIIFDDDVIYHPQCLTTLYRTSQQHPGCIVCNRSNLITFNRLKQVRHYENWIMNYQLLLDTPTYQLLPTGVGGVLYPPNSIPKFAFNQSVLQNIALYVDDLWLKCMATYNNIPIVRTQNNFSFVNIQNSQNNALWRKNIFNNNNDLAFKKIVKYIREKLPYKFDLMEKIRRDCFQ